MIDHVLAHTTVRIANLEGREHFTFLLAINQTVVVLHGDEGR
jgi:hypothetical protein